MISEEMIKTLAAYKDYREEILAKELATQEEIDSMDEYMAKDKCCVMMPMNAIKIYHHVRYLMKRDGLIPPVCILVNEEYETGCLE